MRQRNSQKTDQIRSEQEADGTNWNLRPFLIKSISLHHTVWQPGQERLFVCLFDVRGGVESVLLICKEIKGQSGADHRGFSGKIYRASRLLLMLLWWLVLEAMISHCREQLTTCWLIRQQRVQLSLQLLWLVCGLINRDNLGLTKNISMSFTFGCICSKQNKSNL